MSGTRRKQSASPACKSGPRTVCTIDVADVDEYAKKVESAGGKVTGMYASRGPRAAPATLAPAPRSEAADPLPTSP